jgi:hypothetical protein
MATKNKESCDVPNQFRVPQKQWRKWSVKARQVFNAVYDFMMENQWTMLHPKQEAPKPYHWKTTCWNAAWVAADAVDEKVPTDIVDSKTGAETKVKTKAKAATC